MKRGGTLQLCVAKEQRYKINRSSQRRLELGWLLSPDSPNTFGCCNELPA